MIKRFLYLFIFPLLTLFACQTDSKQVVLTLEPTVASITDEPAAAIAPAATASPSLEPTLSPTTPPLQPTETPDPTPTADPLAAIVDIVVGNLNEKAAIGAYPLADDFFYGDYGGRITTLPSRDLRLGMQNFLTARYAGDTYGIRPLTITADVTSPLPSGLTFAEAAALSPTDFKVDAIVYSSGWGLHRPGEALLYFTRSGELFHWIGAIYSFDQFRESQILAEAKPPRGFDAFLEQDTLRQDQLERVQIAFDVEVWDLSLNPSGSNVLMTEPYTGAETGHFSLIDTVTLEERRFETRDSLQLQAANAVWLLDTIVLVSYRDPQSPEGPNFGPFVLLDTETGQIKIIERESLIQPPQQAGSSHIIYATGEGVFIYDAVVDASLPLDHKDNKLFRAPSHSPNRPFLIVTTQEEDVNLARYTAIYHLIDLDSGKMFEMARADAPPMGGWHPPAVWSAGGRFALIDPWTQFAEQDGLTIVDVERPEQPLFLGVGSDNGRWLPDSNLLLFEAWADGELQTHLYNAESGERSRLSMPEPSAGPLLLPFPQPLEQDVAYYNAAYRIELPTLEDGWRFSPASTEHMMLLEKDAYRLEIALRPLDSPTYIDPVSEVPVGEPVPLDESVITRPLGAPAIQRDVMVDGKRAAVRLTGKESEIELETPHLALTILISQTEDDPNAPSGVPDQIVIEVSQMLWRMWIRERYMAEDRPLEPVAEEELWSSETFTSPDGRWIATNRSFQPYVIESEKNEFGLGPEEHRQTFTVAAADGSRTAGRRSI